MENEQIILPLEERIKKRYEVFVKQLNYLKQNKKIVDFTIKNTENEVVYNVEIIPPSERLLVFFNISLKQTIILSQQTFYYFSSNIEKLEMFVTSLIARHERGFLIEEKVLDLFNRFIINNKSYLNEVKKATEFQDHVQKADLILKINYFLPEVSLRFIVGVQVKSSLTGQNIHKTKYPLVPSFVYDENESEEVSFERIKKLILQIGEFKKNAFIKNECKKNKKTRIINEIHI